MIDINTKNLLWSFFIVLLMLVPTLARAAVGENCITDLTEKLPVDFDWQESFILEGADGSAWQRAIITSPRENIMIDENLPVQIQGAAAKNAPVGIFLFSPFKNSDGAVQVPSMGTCLQAVDADENGFYTLTLDSSVLWDSIDQKVMVDAFYKRTESYAELQGETPGLAFGTFLPPQEYAVKVVTHADDGRGLLPMPPLPRAPLGDIPADALVPQSRSVVCEKLCNANTVLAKRLDPSKTTAQILGSLFDPVGGMPVVIGRMPGKHTFYTGLEEPAGQVDTTAYQKIALAAIATEFVKRGLLGVENAGGINPGLGVLAIDSLRDAATGKGNVSDQTKRIAFSIKSILLDKTEQQESVIDLPPPPPPPPPVGNSSAQANPTVPPPPPTPTPSSAENIPVIPRAEAIAKLKAELEYLGDIDLDAVFPRGVSENEWETVFLQMLEFWTGGATINTCLMTDDTLTSKNLMVSHSKGSQCGMNHSNGVSPLLLLNTDEAVTLSPDFKQTKIVSADRSFDESENFTFPSGKKEVLAYRYDFTTPLSAQFLGTMCVQRKDLPQLLSNITDKYGLSPRETTVLAQELNNEFPDILADEYAQLALAEPAQIASRFRWRGDDVPLNLLQLFFKITPKVCSEKAVIPPALALSQERDGFEVGILL